MDTVPQVALLDGEPGALMDDDQVLELTQRHRRALVGQLTQYGNSYPSDSKDAKVLLTALADMDRTVLAKKRIVSDEKVATQSAEQIEKISRELMKQMQQHRAEFPLIEGEFERVLDLDDSTLPTLVVQDGEMEVGVVAESFEDFRKGYEDKYGKQKNRDS